ncbi:hypothetical protein CTAYLR_008650 [Chrysophaeum taylorii]|uniref:Palmitoyltransferase n=1 Tax=Chrysophaeum taylorii TaxID=2483200 RepID=A0AAD7XHX9_9STRA|nr:hypothetical protein CTAYLR_008650 [Chrysophaeum taylorii]
MTTPTTTTTELPPRRHAFQRSSTWQRVAVVVFIASVGLHWAATAPLEIIWLTVGYLCLVLLCLSLWLRVSTLDPSGNATAGHSYKCRSCAKEVEGFDHHCVFLNTCIGDGNYKTFLALVASLAGLELFHCLAAGRTLARRPDRLLALASALASAALAAPLLALLAFHFYVRVCLGTTTYGWLLERRRDTLEEIEAKHFDQRRERRERARRAEYDYWLEEQAARKSANKKKTADDGDIELGHVRNPIPDDPRARRRPPALPPDTPDAESVDLPRSTLCESPVSSDSDDDSLVAARRSLV